MCYNCIDDSNCLGEERISLDAGFWRRTRNSTTFIECPNNDACLGGYLKETGQLDEIPVYCDRGYGGLLCSECEIVDGDKYERLSEFLCTK